MKKLVPVLMVALAAVVIAAVFFWQELREVRSQASELRAHITELQAARLAAATNPAAAAPATSLPLSVAPAAVAAASVPPAGTATAATGTAAKAPEAQGIEALMQQMLGTTEGRDLMKSQLRMALPQQYPDLAKELGLTPAEADKFFDMLVNQQLGNPGMDLLGGNALQDPAAIQELQRKAQEAQRANQAELNAMLGDKLPKWQEYQRTLPQRRQVTQLQAALGTGNNALGDVQGRQLMKALAAEQAQIQQERRNAPPPQQVPTNPQAAIEQQLARAEADNRRLVSAASSHLNPQQLDSYRQMLEQQQSLQTLLLRGIGSQLAPQASGPQPAAAQGR